MGSHRRRSCSPATAPPLEDDDLLSEILLRLSPHPSSLPRASAVCKQWRRLVSDPRFFRRFRLHHRRNPPLLGFFDTYDRTFRPTLESPSHIPAGRFSSLSDFNRCLGCRHGLVLDIHHALSSPNLNQVLVWDPVTGDKHRVLLPPRFAVTCKYKIHGAVLGAAGDAHNFQVVLVGCDIKDNARTLACVYSSETGLWSNIISKPACELFFADKPSVLVGNCLYWLLIGSKGILQFDLERQSLAVVPLPMSMCTRNRLNRFSVMRAEGGGLGFIFLSEDCKAQLWKWKRKTDSDGVAAWELGRTIRLNKTLSLNITEEIWLLSSLRGFAEINNVVILWTYQGAFMIQLGSLQFKKLPDMCCHHAFESVYAAGMGIGGRPDGAELLHNV